MILQQPVHWAFLSANDPPEAGLLIHRKDIPQRTQIHGVANQPHGCEVGGEIEANPSQCQWIMVVYVLPQ